MDKAIENFLELPAMMRKTVTFDNGTENAAHMRLNSLGIETFFCHPYQSWEKGAVENMNGLIRRIFPKDTNFSEVTPEQIKIVENMLNNRPRKCLNYMTAIEVMRLCTS